MQPLGNTEPWYQDDNVYAASMSFQIHVDPDVNCTFVRYTAFVQGEGLSAIDQAIQNPKFRHGMNILRDTQQVALPDYLDYAWFKHDFDDIYSREHLLMQGSSFAWLVGSASDYAKAHSWALVTRGLSGQNRKAFRQLDEAMNWLGIPAVYTISYDPTYSAK